MIAVTGPTGFVGRALCAYLESRGERVLRIGRRDADLAWPIDGADFDDAAIAALRDVRAVVHLAGESIGERWTADRRRSIRDSRVTLTATLARAMAEISPTPAVLISASAVGFYGDRGDDVLDEMSAPGTDFLARITQDWESATAPASAAGVRVSMMRLGIVLGPGGGMLARLRLPFTMTLGARLGDGRQWMSWISLDDAVRWIVRSLYDDEISGPINVVSPNPVTNADFTRALGRAVGRPAPFVAPAFALRIAFGEMADGVLLASQRVSCAKMLDFGFSFEHPSLDDTLRLAVGS